MAGGTMPAGSGGPGWPLASMLFLLGDLDRGFEVMREIGGEELEYAIPVERCFYWEMLADAELARGRLEAAEAHVRSAEEQAERLGLHLPTAVATRGRAAVLLHAGEPGAAASAAEDAIRSAEAVGARLPAAYARALRGQALAAAGERKQAIEALKEAERELDECGSVRERDAVRRELRKLGARAEKRGPAAGADSGIPSLTKRELEIAALVTDRKTNREIAAELFLSDKTVESHLRNIFVKLGASSRVEVARAVERDQRERERRARGAVTDVVAPPADPDALRLAELGYPQELKRGLRIFGNVAMGFAAISPVVGLYAVVLVGTTVAGPAWVWVLPVALAGQCLLITVYSELAVGVPDRRRRLPVEPPAYGRRVRVVQRMGGDLRVRGGQHDDRLPGRPVGAHARWGSSRPRTRSSRRGCCLVLFCSLAGALGLDLLGRAIRLGIAAEALASVGIGLALLLVFREQDLSIFGETLGAEALSGGSVLAGLLAALAVGGWVFIGFDACVGASEETQNAARHVPRAIWIALLGVGGIVILNAFAVTLAHPDPAAVVAGEDIDPVTTAVVSSFGSWSSKPFAASRAGRLPGVRDGGAGAHREVDLLDRARRRASRRPPSCARSTAARRR